MQYKDLAQKLADIGRPLTPVAIRDAENGKRKVDVDDLMAFAIVFGVSPLTLLLPDSGSPYVMAGVTGYPHDLSSNVLWMWAGGYEPLELTDVDVKRQIAEYRERALPSSVYPRYVEDAGEIQLASSGRMGNQEGVKGKGGMLDFSALDELPIEKRKKLIQMMVDDIRESERNQGVRHVEGGKVSMYDDLE